MEHLNVGHEQNYTTELDCNNKLSPIGIFVYGSLKSCLQNNYDQATKEVQAFNGAGRRNSSVQGLRLYKGNEFPYAVFSFSLDDKAYGEIVSLSGQQYHDAIEELDTYEGVSEGYYKRCIGFANDTYNPANLFLPVWVYVAGENISVNEKEYAGCNIVK